MFESLLMLVLLSSPLCTLAVRKPSVKTAPTDRPLVDCRRGQHPPRPEGRAPIQSRHRSRPRDPGDGPTAGGLLGALTPGRLRRPPRGEADRGLRVQEGARPPRLPGSDP